ncbi:hypothetical protein [Paenibacillus sp. FSL H3-0333]|uniref:hypothetical protein n=1 Tax=Paenibacillus sp. FSL H3-0333 TaxID=2921373 RepID=UPI0030F89FEC
MKSKQLIAGLMVSASLILAVTPISAGSFQEDASGGWSETEGNFVNNVSTFKNGEYTTFGPPVGSSPEVHRGERQSRNYSSSDIQYRVYGYTAWEGKYHYTVARFESWYDGSTLGDSGRVYGRDVTQAYSSWENVNFSSYTAKTYWGS